MKKNIDKVICQTPTPGKKPTRIDQWKYNAVRTAIRKVLTEKQDGVAFKDLSRLVSKELSQEELSNLGSAGWYTTTVKLDMEVKGEIERVIGSKPQRLVFSS